MPKNKEILDLKGVRKGDRKAFENIYRSYRDGVYAFAYRMVSSRAIAEEVTHEAFLVLITQPQRYDTERGSIFTFLCSIARNHIMHHLRRTMREIEEPFEEFDSADSANYRESGEQLKQLLDEELVTEIDRAIRCLPALFREAIILREFQQLSYAQIAEVTETSIDTVKVRLHRARRALAKELAPYVQEQRGVLS